MKSNTKDTVLIVDDEAANLSVLFEQLYQANFRVLVAEDGTSALKRTRRVTPDIILLDVKLPDIDGFSLCRQLRQMPALDETPIIFLSVMSDAASKVYGLGLSAVDYITKPFHVEEVVARIERHLTLRKLRLSLQEKNSQLEAEIVKRKRVEAQLWQHQEQLEELVTQRTRELQLANQSLLREMAERKQAEELLIRTEKLATASRLSASLAHEINNPLQSVTGLVALLREKLAKTEHSEYLRIINSELQRVTTIVKRMHSLYHSTDEAVSTDINTLLQDTLTLVQKESGKNGVELIWQPENDLPTVMLVRSQIHQVFLNLLLNGIEAMPSGGPLHVRTTYKPNVGISIEVSDQGVGMSPDTQAQIFDPFYTTKEEGLGLGLFICFGIIEQLRGTIEVDSQLGEGSTFTVWLPVKENER